MPSWMSTRITRPASSFSARRCAVVAPTFPAPTTVILFTISIFCWVEPESYPSQYARAMGARPSATSTADLGERAQSANAHLKEMMLERFLFECALEQWTYRTAGPERLAEIHRMVAEKTRPQPAVGCETHTVAGAAVGVRHRSDHTDRSESAADLIVLGRAVAT